MDELGRGIGQLKNLQSLEFIFENYSALSSVDELGRGIGERKNLQSLQLYFSFCSALSSMDAMQKIKDFEATGTDCTVWTPWARPESA